MRADRDTSDRWVAAPIDLLCVRIVVDARAAPLLVRAGPEAGASADEAEPGAALREATATLRQLYGAWLATGIGTEVASSPTSAHALLQRWRRLPVPGGAGTAAVATLLIASQGALITGPVATSATATRVALEALATAPATALLLVELVANGAELAWPGITTALPDPPLEILRSPDPRQRFCACGLPLPSGVERCAGCHRPLDDD